MEKKLIVLADWKGESEFQQFKTDVEACIQNGNTFFYLFCIDNHKLIEGLPHIPNVSYLSKKEFSMFGKLKTPMLRALLINENSGVLIVAAEKPSKLLLKTLKNSKLMSIGMEKETLPKFDISFKNSELKDGKFFKQINNYLTKIQL
ncbi:MAG TPA: hypothetical protein VFD77_04565 [Brumimicrobium sp.]|nr:hypothetical protein [Brumimicrobium sp.]